MNFYILSSFMYPFALQRLYEINFALEKRETIEVNDHYLPVFYNLFYLPTDLV